METTGASAAETASLLLAVGAVTLSPEAPFTWASGLRSPIYCDNRLLMSHPAERSRVAAALATLIRERFAKVEVLAATATGAIPHAAWVAQLLALPMIFVRSEAKGHGRRNLIEGRLEPGRRVVVIEDTVSTGGSCRRTVAAVRAAGGIVLGAAAIFSYGFATALANFDRDDIRFASLTDFPTLLSVAAGRGTIDLEERGRLLAWREGVSFDA